jgi:hypothetical protein
LPANEVNMKKVPIIILTAVFCFQACAQKLTEDKVPQSVKDGFKKTHPNVKASWEREDADYEANFTSGGKAMSCVINKEGTILETETVLSLSDLPANAKAYLEKNYKGKKVKEVAKVEKNGVIEYEVVINSKEIMFDSNGNFKEEEKGEKKEKD